MQCITNCLNITILLKLAEEYDRNVASIIHDLPSISYEIAEK